MNIHTQQANCEAEIAAGARGLGAQRPATACWNGHNSSGCGDVRYSQAPKLMPEQDLRGRSGQRYMEMLGELIKQ